MFFAPRPDSVAVIAGLLSQTPTARSLRETNRTMATARKDQDPGVKPWLLGAGSLVAVLAVVKLLLHLYAGRHYGYFVDELYYLACAQHLDWGYVDQPPLIALIAKKSRAHCWAIRFSRHPPLPRPWPEPAWCCSPA